MLLKFLTHAYTVVFNGKCNNTGRLGYNFGFYIQVDFTVFIGIFARIGQEIEEYLI